MASNPKYGVTYKTTDGKTKTITGLNLGTSGYSEQEITTFVGIVTSSINKEVLSVNVTAANSIPPPEPPTPTIPDLINSLAVVPDKVTITAGESATAEILIETSPADAVYSLSTSNSPSWVSIDDTTLVFTPDATLGNEEYVMALEAATKDDTETATIEALIQKKEKEIPSLTFYSTRMALNDLDDKGGTATNRIITSSSVDASPKWTISGNSTLLSDWQEDGRWTVKGYYAKAITSTSLRATVAATENYKGAEVSWSISKPTDTNRLSLGAITVKKYFEGVD